MKVLSLLIMVLFALTACAPGNAPGVQTPGAPSPRAATLTPTAGAPGVGAFTLTPSATVEPSATLPPIPIGPSPTPEVYHVVAVSLRVRGSAQSQPEVDAGTSAVIELAFEPVILTILRGPDGSASGYSTARWENAQVAQMRTCLAAGTGCSPPQDWSAFQASASTSVQVDWLGPRPFYAWAEFRDGLGKLILSTGPSNPVPKTQTTAGLVVRGKANPATPLAKLPAPVQTALAATRAAFPVSGSVLIKDGICCAGGPAGSKISLKVAFQASSPASSVTEMKVQTGGGCVRDAAQLQGGWEPYLATRSYEATLAINWVGWWVSVQYRDAAGNLSPVYCDDISLEGSP